jgi:AcrR family transcriptional regulator
MRLSRPRILAAAMDLIERDGGDALSMPALAADLGCAVMTLYAHVPSKAALLDAVADAVVASVEYTPAPDAPWPEQIRAQATAFRQAARARPRCTMITLSRPPSSLARLRPTEHALATLRGAGFSPADSVRIVRTLAAYTLGSLRPEADAAPAPGAPASGRGDSGADRRPRLTPAAFPQLTSLATELNQTDADGDYEFGLDLFLHAAAALLSAARS